MYRFLLYILLFVSFASQAQISVISNRQYETGDNEVTQYRTVANLNISSLYGSAIILPVVAICDEKIEYINKKMQAIWFAGKAGAYCLLSHASSNKYT